MPHRDLLETMLKRQEVLADFADLALQSEDLDEVLQEACRLVAKAMGTERAKVLEMEAGDESLLVRAGVGWAAGVVGHVRLPMDEHSSEAFAINAGEPVITPDIAHEERFDVPRFMKDASIVALVNVPIFLPRQRPMGSCRWTTPGRGISTSTTVRSCAPMPASWGPSLIDCSSLGT
ncbi:GAF domain-containing protein [Paracoccus sp. S-4012]|uniref:GAF domain-containing protein n=1 Tax=Paracoccus sp. S-4012 TaxID=2665648 RepID=UPI0012B14727|nr:GAF domain-containing protein [Paracoccus sp. S-4012]MRX51647.1 GAF domain-containing protein [Paracoccus sp. S-4012]